MCWGLYVWTCLNHLISANPTREIWESVITTIICSGAYLEELVGLRLRWFKNHQKSIALGSAHRAIASQSVTPDLYPNRMIAPSPEEPKAQKVYGKIGKQDSARCLEREFFLSKRACIGDKMCACLRQLIHSLVLPWFLQSAPRVSAEHMWCCLTTGVEQVGALGWRQTIDTCAFVAGE